MTFEYLKNLKTNNQTLKILNSENFSMVISFFYIIFIEQKNITLKHSIIVDFLDDYLYNLNETYDNIFPKSSISYLNDFCSDKYGYLRKYHGSDDEAYYELTPYTQKALEFLQDLEKKEFVGTRTKFNVILELLEDLEFETNYNDEQRIKSLEEEKKELDRKIKDIKEKKDIRFDNSRIKEHFMLLEETARKLKYDFTQIEYNFRNLNDIAMEQIATRDDGKGDVLESIFDIEDNIREQNQGKSFFAFWKLLTDAKKSEKLSSMLDNLYENETIKEFDKNEKLKSLKYELLQSGQKVSNVSYKLIEQLRRYLDDRVWIENKRILELCKSIEKTALTIKRDIPKTNSFFEIKGEKSSIKSVFENSLYEIKENKDFITTIEEKHIDINLDSFYHQFFIDESILKENIKQLLLYKPQCSLDDINKEFGIKKGIAELIGYLSIAKNSPNAIVDEKFKIKLEIKDFDGDIKIVSLPKIVFVK
ncbi:MAG: DUF3375 family protein [Campylobacterota bacterium]|nr:DUF3375 family protein [Campylobacterota bacterium]